MLVTVMKEAVVRFDRLQTMAADLFVNVYRTSIMTDS